jgi:GPH family glycoside/pentoside/hexuronide:cation symporter
MRLQQPAGQTARISLTTKLFYGSGQAVDAIVQAVINTFLLFYLTAVCGLSGAAAGSIFLVSLVADGLLDPFIGRLSDNWRSSWGRRLPFMIVALPPMMIAAALIFNLPVGTSDAVLYIYALLLNIMLRVGLSVFALPHSALTAELSDDYSERSVLSTFRALFIVLGTAAALLPAFAFLFAGEGALQAKPPYQWLGLLTACLIGGFGFTCVLGIFRTARVLPVPDKGAHSPGFFADLLQLFHNPSFVPMFVGAVLVLVGQGATTALNLHAYRYFWELPPAYMQLPLLILPVGMLVGTLAAGLLLTRIEKRDGVLGAVAVLGLYQILITLLAITGIVAPGSTLAIFLVAINGLLFGGCGAMCFVCFYSMIADAVDEHDHLFGVRREALYAAALMIGAKAATGIGAFLSGLGLQLIGFSAPANGSGAAVPAETATAVGLLWGIGGALLILAAIPLLRRYRIDRARHAAVLASIAERNRNAQSNMFSAATLAELASSVQSKA